MAVIMVVPFHTQVSRTSAEKRLTMSDQSLEERADKAVRAGFYFQGQVYMMKPMKDDPTQFLIVSMSFYSMQEFQEVYLQLTKMGFKPFGGGHPGAINPSIPKCPNHSDMRPSKKKGEWYCPTKLADGTFCKY